MSTLNERFSEKFHNWVHPYDYIDGKTEDLNRCFIDIRGEDVEAMSDSFRLFIKEEFEALAQEIEAYDPHEYAIEAQEGFSTAAAIIRSRAKELEI